MISYKNLSHVSKTFWGVTFMPFETKSVSGWINDPDFIMITTSEPKFKSKKKLQSHDMKIQITETEKGEEK